MIMVIITMTVVMNIIYRLAVVMKSLYFLLYTAGDWITIISVL